MNDKLVLGTAQVGFSYGIANKRGKPSKLEAYKIMQTAVEYNIDCFDTAYSYGTSEEITHDVHASGSCRCSRNCDCTICVLS